MQQDVLAGVRILEVAQWWFVPASAAVLADWGADVIKVEHPVTGDPQRGLAAGGFSFKVGGVDFMMQQSNRGKRSVGIDIKTPEGRELLYKLAAKADVFLTSLLPDARRRLGIDVEHIRAVNPDIIYVRGSGQGVRGPDAEKGGYDASSFWARGGIAHALTRPDIEMPVMPRAAFGDSTGALTLAGGIAAALFRRERSGTPSVVDVSLLNTAMWVLAPDIVVSKLVEGGQGMPSFGRHNVPNPLANAYKTRDDRWLLLMMLQPDRHWVELCEHVGHADLAADERFTDGPTRFQNREACIAELDAAFASRSLAEWFERLASFTGPWAPMQSAAEIHDDPQALANGYLPEVDVDGKKVKLVASPVQFDETPLESVAPSPDMGQHTEEVLLELGIEWDEITRYKEAKAIN
jgi:crotonobetainyl-CoA:carnitine CoA-transferase CaiB-like acyl-CoA transferase